MARPGISTHVKSQPLRHLARRLRLFGAERIPSRNLLVTVLGGPPDRRYQLADTLLFGSGGLAGLLRLDYHDLRRAGLGGREAWRWLGIRELLRRAAIEAKYQPTVDSPHAAHRLLWRLLAGRTRERFAVVVLDIKNRPCRVHLVAEGGIDNCPVDMREIFAPAVHVRGSSIIVGHNHPSGDLTPSTADLELTRRILQAGYLLRVNVLDHLIVGERRFVSLASLGCMDGADNVTGAP